MIQEILAVGPLASNCVVLGDAASREAVVIDPGDEAARILDTVSRHHLTVTRIVATHGHFDHVGALAEVKLATGAPAAMHASDLVMYERLREQTAWFGMEPPKLASIDQELHDGETLRVGAVEFTVLHTPGHTPGSIGLWFPSEKTLASGDTLFRESIGRTDLPGGDGRGILVSIREKFLPLPDDTVVIPGHGPTTTMAHEKRWNYFFQHLGSPAGGTILRQKGRA